MASQPLYTILDDHSPVQIIVNLVVASRVLFIRLVLARYRLDELARGQMGSHNVLVAMTQ